MENLPATNLIERQIVSRLIALIRMSKEQLVITSQHERFYVVSQFRSLVVLYPERCALNESFSTAARFSTFELCNRLFGAVKQIS